METETKNTDRSTSALKKFLDESPILRKLIPLFAVFLVTILVLMNMPARPKEQDGKLQAEQEAAAKAEADKLAQWKKHMESGKGVEMDIFNLDPDKGNLAEQARKYLITFQLEHRDYEIVNTDYLILLGNQVPSIHQQCQFLIYYRKIAHSATQ